MLPQMCVCVPPSGVGDERRLCEWRTRVRVCQCARVSSGGIGRGSHLCEWYAYCVVSYKVPPVTLVHVSCTGRLCPMYSHSPLDSVTYSIFRRYSREVSRVGYRAVSSACT